MAARCRNRRLHWAGPAALHLLQHLVRELADGPVLVVAGYRDTGEAAGDHLRSALADLAREDAVRIELVGFDRSALQDLVRARVTTTAGRDVSQVVDRLEAETAGNPLFAEHLLRHWATGRQFAVDDEARRPEDTELLRLLGLRAQPRFVYVGLRPRQYVFGIHAKSAQ